ncbi:MAG TPA: helix-turn-helix transcriptional regulator [Dehalococcoidia bacterium]|nr:helix-turn-helix transcriptional regulator [Dehalococcoidia bacterium]
MPTPDDEHEEANPEETAPSGAPAGPQPPPALTPPRDLLTAYLLLLLRNWNMHGYQLMQQLMLFGYQTNDPGSIYRQLRQLERQGFIRSSWETGEAGPARRTYTLTDAGNAFLNGWATAIENYQKTLKFWSDLYAGMVNPFKTE